MRIRSFQKDDQLKVLELWQRCGLIVPWNDPAADIERKLLIQPELFLIGSKDSKLIGSAMGGYDGHRGWIYYLAVDPDHRGQGNGRKLVDYLAGQLRAKGCPKINIMVRTTNSEMIDFYLKLGFKGDEVVCLGKRLPDD